ncbi:hypothetical protein OEZ85_011035 [Tetradesmus obliquus]|uniref:PCI domain-containing protein n=1 Tax=Tetradesmus obliquus TaxID=3088 RepID=A0ABY8TP22_TETOB|nr:hypothetical protein OEZ85_011035 [Tetradesmus obliquus]
MTALQHLFAAQAEWGAAQHPFPEHPIVPLPDQEYGHQAYLRSLQQDLMEVGDEWLQQMAHAAAAGEMAEEQADIVRRELAERHGRQQQQHDILQRIRSFRATRRLWSPHRLLPRGGAEHLLLFAANAPMHPTETYDKPLKWRTYVEQLLKAGTMPPGFRQPPAMPRFLQRIAHELAMSYMRNAPLWMQLLVVVKALDADCSAIRGEATAGIEAYMSKRRHRVKTAHMQMLAEERQAVTPVVMEAVARAGATAVHPPCVLELIQDVVLRDVYGDCATDTVQVYRLAPVIGLAPGEILQRIADNWSIARVDWMVQLLVHELDKVPAEVAHVSTE